jgi:hypothetical protein
MKISVVIIALFIITVISFLYLLDNRKSTDTKIFLLYNDEDISQYQHPDVIPYKIVNQTVYFESQAFAEITNLPDATNIGFITPSFLKKQKLTIKQVFDKSNKAELKSTYFLVDGPDNRIQAMTKFHGPTFKKIWNWLLSELGYQEYVDADFFGGSSNMWIARREFVEKFLDKLKQAILICDNAPEEMRKLLYSDPRYEGNIKHLMFKKFGIPHYPYHPFIMENLIALFTYLDNINKF